MKNHLLKSFLILAVAVGGVPGGLSGGVAAAEDIPEQELRELTEIYGLIRKNYVEDIEGSELLKRAMRGMVSSLDPHSSYLNNEERKNFIAGLTNEEYGGVGTYIGTRDGWIEIISPIYDSPAYRAGLEAGSLILKIDGVSTQGMEISEAVDKMRGIAGTVINLDVLPRGGTVRQVELVRETIVSPSVLFSLVEGNYGYLRITQFKNRTTENLVGAVNGLYEESGGDLNGIVLDLRNNPGGYLEAGIQTAAMFLGGGVVVVREKQRDATQVHDFVASPDTYRALTHRQEVLDVPMIVLVNGGSASASEIVAGALQDYRRAVILGNRTYGKASVQRVVQLASTNGKSALRLTTSRYYTPLDRNIQALGIVPDVEVNQVEVTEQKEGFVLREGDLSGHLENDSADDTANGTAAGNEGDGSTPQNEVLAEKRPPFIGDNDYQYDQALQILKAIAITASR